MDDDYLETVLVVAEQVPPGRVTTYGLVADALGRGGPRQVGAALARNGGGVPWWRVVRADGSLPAPLAARARREYLQEQTPLLASGRVDLVRAVWHPRRGPESVAGVSAAGG